MKLPLSALLMALSATPASSQSVNYKSAEAVAGVSSQLGYFATGKKDCSAAPPPSIRVITPPKHGLLTVRRGTMTTNKVPNCPNLQMPANVIFYTGNAGYVGPDEIVYEVTDIKGEVGLYNITVTVKEGPKPAAKPPALTAAITASMTATRLALSPTLMAALPFSNSKGGGC